MKDVKALKTSVMDTVTTVMKHHAIIAILTALGIMILSVYTISQVIIPADDVEYRTEKEAGTIRTNFDKATIEKISRLRDRQQNVSPTLPSTRINPFSE